MSGGIHFGIKLDKPKAHSIMLGGGISGFRHDKIDYIGEFICTYTDGYVSQSHYPDSELIDLLRKHDKRGYYVEMNDTTNIGDGKVRFHEGGALIDLCELVDDNIGEEEEVYEGPNSSLYCFMIGAPHIDSIYTLLDSERFPYIKY